MLNTSFEFRRAAADEALVLPRGQVVQADGKRIDLEPRDFVQGSVSFTHATSSQGSFDIGAAIVGSMSCTLDNERQRLSGIDFYGARIVMSVGIELEDGVEWLRKGTYWVDAPDALAETISLSCLDSMAAFDVPYDGVSTRYPATAQRVVLDLCAHCGVPLLYAAFANSDAVFKSRPAAGASCRDVLSWAAQATGNYARITADDRLELSWYDPSVFDEEDWLDGEDFDDGSPYQSGSDADGGTFDDYASGTRADGGTFETGNIVGVYAYSDATVRTGDVTVTGIRVTASDEVRADGSLGEKGETALAGSKGYVLEVSGNPLIAYGTARDFARRIANQCAGLTFRPFDVSCIGDPRVEAGDPAIITDRYQTAHRGYLTSVTYRVGSYAAYSCSAESPMGNAASSSSALTRAVAGLGDSLRAEISEREAAVQRLNDDLANSPGVYTTKKVEGGGTTTYVHDKKDLKDSAFVWKMNAAGFGMSTDGGKTYAYGLDKWGNAILNTVYAIGLDASYIKAGVLRVAKGTKTIFEANFATGTVSITPTTFSWSSTYSSLTTAGKLTVTGGKIGGFTVSSSALYNGRSSLNKNAKGVYVGTDGIAVGAEYGKAHRFVRMEGGQLSGGANSTVHGYISFTKAQWGAVAAGLTLSSKGDLYLGCEDIKVCDSLGTSPQSTIIVLGTGVTDTVKLLSGVTVTAPNVLVKLRRQFFHPL